MTLSEKMPDDLLAAARAAKGFMPDDEGAFLFDRAVEQGPQGGGGEEAAAKFAVQTSP